MPLNLALRVAAVIVILATGLYFLVNGEFLLQPVIIANILFVISLFAGYQTRRIALITLLFCVVLMTGTVKFYLEGEHAIPWALPWAIMEFVVFGCLGFVAWKNIRGNDLPT
jgi:hypothetical protein